MIVLVVLRNAAAWIATILWCSTAILLWPVWRRSVAVLQTRWARCVLGLAGVRVRTEWETKSAPPVIYASNHQSALDILVLLGHLESVRFVSKVELSRAPFIGMCGRLGEHIFIDRARKRQAVEALRTTAEDIHSVGRSVVIFPEGTHFRDRLGPFKRGVAQLAKACGLPIVPVAIRNTPDLMPSGATLARPGAVEVRVGAPIASEEVEGDRELLARLRAEIERLGDYPAS